MNTLPALTRTISQDRIDAYADASRDHNPIHVDAGFAASSPFAGTIAHGMLVLALIGETMHTTCGDAWLTSGRLKVRFKAPARPGDSITAAASAVRNDAERAEYAVQCINQLGELLIEGRASVANA